MRGFFVGIGDFFSSFRWWRRTAGPMKRTLLPALVVWVTLFIGVVAFAIAMPTIVPAVTPFANEWSEPWQSILRIGIGLGLIAAVIFFAIRVYSSVTQLVSEVAYGRLRLAVREQLGSTHSVRRVGVAKHVGGAVADVARGVPVAAVTFGLSFIPVVGVVASWLTGAMMGGRGMGRSMVEPNLDVTLPDEQRDALLRTHSARLTGFGFAAQLAMIIPIVGILAMPTVVAGGAALSEKIKRADPPA